MDTNLHVLAGIVSTAIFISSNLPMLVKAYRSKSLKSYSFANIIMSNGGNVINWGYVVSLPFGPVWLMHSFYTVTTVIMLVWYVKYEGLPTIDVDKLKHVFLH